MALLSPGVGYPNINSPAETPPSLPRPNISDDDVYNALQCANLEARHAKDSWTGHYASEYYVDKKVRLRRKQVIIARLILDHQYPSLAPFPAEKVVPNTLRTEYGLRLWGVTRRAGILPSLNMEDVERIQVPLEELIRNGEIIIGEERNVGRKDYFPRFEWPRPPSPDPRFQIQISLTPPSSRSASYVTGPTLETDSDPARTFSRHPSLDPQPAAAEFPQDNSLRGSTPPRSPDPANVELGNFITGAESLAILSRRLQREANSISDEMRSLRSENDDLRNDCDYFEGEVARLERERNSLHHQISCLQEEKHALQDEMKKLERDFEVMQGSNVWIVSHLKEENENMKRRFEKSEKSREEERRQSENKLKTLREAVAIVKEIDGETDNMNNDDEEEDEEDQIEAMDVEKVEDGETEDMDDEEDDGEESAEDYEMNDE